ncbi:13254_t:CDS:2, partial [Acaulospora morrowiae]
MSLDDGNRFGDEIEYRQGKAIQLISYIGSESEDGTGEITVNPCALEIIKNIEEPIAVISVVGSYRRGKSYFANLFHGRHDGFELGAKTQGCTRGIFMWDSPFLHNGNRVLVLDCEGIDDPNQDINWATKLFILCLAISSTFVYNINGIVGRGDVGKLYLMTNLNKYIKRKDENYQEEENNDVLPRLVVLLRDFGLDEPDSFREYFLEKLQQVDSEAAAGITNHFKDFDVYGLPHPGCKRKQIQHLEEIQTSDLDQEFIEKTSQSVQEILCNLTAKCIFSVPLTGTSFSKFLTGCINHMNSSKHCAQFSIPDEYEIIVHSMSALAFDIGTTYYNTMMTVREIDDFPVSWENFECYHHEHMLEAETIFREKCVGNVGDAVERKFYEKISKIEEEFRESNSKRLKKFNETVAEKLWDEIVKPGLTAENLYENYLSFDNILETFSIRYHNQCILSYEAHEILEKFREKIIPDSISQLDVMFEFRNETEEIQALERIVEQDIKEAQEELENLLIGYNEDTNDTNEKIDELLRRIEEMKRQIQDKDLKRDRSAGVVPANNLIAASHYAYSHFPIISLNHCHHVKLKHLSNRHPKYYKCDATLRSSSVAEPTPYHYHHYHYLLLIEAIQIPSFANFNR